VAASRGEGDARPSVEPAAHGHLAPLGIEVERYSQTSAGRFEGEGIGAIADHEDDFRALMTRAGGAIRVAEMLRARSRPPQVVKIAYVHDQAYSSLRRAYKTGAVHGLKSG